MSAAAAPIAPTSRSLGGHLDARDRRMLTILLGLIALLFVLLAVFTPSQDRDSPIPSTYSSSKHGAKAAFTFLQQSGYPIERWEQPLAFLAERSGPTTVLILADPFTINPASRKAVATILDHGGRVIATGLRGGLILPGNHATISNQIGFAACEAQPEGLETLAGTGPIWIVPSATWKPLNPESHVAYTCAGQPVVVEYSAGNAANPDSNNHPASIKQPGHAIWWASSSPLENSSIERGQNLELLLNSIGSKQGVQIYWDESLHGRVNSAWDFVHGPTWPLLLGGSIGLAMLVILSYSRRSGPIRALPQAPRTTPIEFIEALGALYRSTGATSTALQIEWERFRSQAAIFTGQRTSKLDARELAYALDRRFGSVSPDLEADLINVHEACYEDALKPRRALALVRVLRRHEETFRTVSRHSDKFQ